MKINKKLLIIAVMLCTLSTTQAQPFVGLGYTQGFEMGFLHDQTGMDLSIQQKIKIRSSRWSVMPILHMSMLYSNIAHENFPEYSTAVSLVPSIAFDIVNTKRFKITPFFGIGARWDMNYLPDDTYWAIDDRVRDAKGVVTSEFKPSIEFGVAFDITILKKVTLRLVPIDVLRESFNNNEEDSHKIRQEVLSILIKIGS